MILGSLIRRVTGPATSVQVSRMAVMAIHTAAQGFSPAQPSLAVLSVIRKAALARARADMPLLAMSVARRRAQTSRGDLPLLAMSVARRAPATTTPSLASRMAVMVVHSV